MKFGKTLIGALLVGILVLAPVNTLSAEESGMPAV